MALPTQALRALCAAGGSLELDELLRRLPGRPAAEQLAAVLRDPRRFTLVRTPGGAGAAAAAAAESVLVVATSALRLCPEHGAGCRGGCGQLHLCKYHLKGVCRNQQARKECRFVHNFSSPHNQSVLIQHGLDTFSNDELRQLLLQNDPTLLPEVCLYYNKGDGPYGSCTFKKACTKLHVCQYFLRGQCRFGSSCKRCHDFSKSECYEKLERQGLSSDVIQKLPSIYRNMYAIQDGKGGKHDTEDNKSSPYKDSCIRTHFHLPYRWQISDGSTWKDLENMEEIEKEYCDPNNVRSTRSVSERGFISSYISFVDMQSGLRKVRRLSTASSVTKPPHFILTTEWNWYWKDEYGVWREYGKKDNYQVAATVTSDDLEKAYTASSSKLNFKAGVHEYELDFEGSYFARDASYSDTYCREGSCTKTMFLARVLVGEFTVGNSSYVRPPLKDNQNFYDSCVNSSSNPSIFVIFEKQQVYPEYLIEYLDQAFPRMV
ncbi:UNVERIFIED_CONTAM: hypothetical protein H355_011432 [Colinus virginianus]|nr:hypothetical protein H355_011432 [Colinus virginianus]